jgi:hypothetical protein
MMKSTRWIAFLIMMLGLSMLACGLGGGDDEGAVAPTSEAVAETTEEEGSETAVASAPEPTDSPEPAPTDTAEPEPTETAEPVGALDIAAISGRLDDLGSYRAIIDMTFEGKNAADEDVLSFLQMNAVYIKEPPATSFNIRMEGFESAPIGQEMAMELVTIGDTTYTSIGSFGCFSGSSSEMGADANPFEELLNPQSELLSDLNDPEYVGEEEHNGYESDCYEFDRDDIDDSNMGQLDELEGKLCVSQEFGHVAYIRIEGSGAGAAQFLGEGTGAEDGVFVLEYNIFDINAPLEFEIPAGCDATGADSPWPIVEDAVEVNQFAGLISYRTEAEFDAIVTFYNEEMAILGFEAEDDPLIIAGTSALLSYTDGEQTVAVSINEASAWEGFQVLIAPEE